MIGDNVPDAYTAFSTGTSDPHATKTRLGGLVWNLIREHNTDISNTSLLTNRAHISAYHLQEGHYCISLTFGDQNLVLPNNSHQALQRLRSLSLN